MKNLAFYKSFIQSEFLSLESYSMILPRAHKISPTCQSLTQVKNKHVHDYAGYEHLEHK